MFHRTHHPIDTRSPRDEFEAWLRVAAAEPGDDDKEEDDEEEDDDDEEEDGTARMTRMTATKTNQVGVGARSFAHAAR